MTENLCGPEQIAENIAVIRADIAALAPAPESVTLMAVTKTRTPEIVNAAWRGGARFFGENRAQELRDRFDSYDFGAESIHFIGALQSNKVKYLDGRVCCVQSVDFFELAAALSTRFADDPMRICIEVNIGGEESKSGIPAGELEPLMERLSPLPGIRVCGLMCIPPPETVPEGNRRYFAAMHDLFVDIQSKKIDNISMEILSMGMSGDYRSALREGTTLIRIGTGIFGPRIR